MADKEHLASLRAGVDAWNAWRKEHSDTAPDLSEVDLRETELKGIDVSSVDLKGANLSGVNFCEAILSGANLCGVNFYKANLIGADLRETDLRHAYLDGALLRWAHFTGAKLFGVRLSGADLREAKLDGVDLREADLSGADLREADLSAANLREANLSEADLREADLSLANLNEADLWGADLTEAQLYETIFVNIDLSATKGLNACYHIGPSALDHRTLQQSGRLPLAFLRGCGLSDWEIEAAKLHEPGLTSEQITDIVYRVHDLRSTRPIQIYRLFISYSHADSVFLEHMERHLNELGIRLWRDIHDAPAGPLENIILCAIRHNPTVLLVLSENSVSSDWVEYEAQTARELEKELGRHVLCPVALDKSWETCGWSGVLRNQIKKYNVLNFSDWQEPTAFEGKFQRLLSGIDLFYGDSSPFR